MTRIEKIKKTLRLKKDVYIELTGKELGFEVYEYDLDSPKRIMYITDSDFKKSSEDSKHQLQFYKKLSEGIYEL